MNHSNLAAGEDVVMNAQFEASAFREVLGHYPTGVVVVTGIADDGEVVGMVVGTFSSVSLDPPLVSFMPAIGSATFQRLRTATSYCINVLAYDQIELCRAMSARGPDKFAEVQWALSPYGAPMLDRAVAYVHCASERTIELGDHFVEVCSVLAFDVRRAVTPLLFFQGGYGGFSLQGMSAVSGTDLVAAVQLGEVVRPLLEQLAHEVGCVTILSVAVSEDTLVPVASGHSGPGGLDVRLGESIPLIPPLGLSYVAFLSDLDVEAWLRRSPSKDPDVHARYRRQVAETRRRGWSIATMRGADSSFPDIRSALQEYRRDQVTPAKDRALRSALEMASGIYDSVDLDHAEVMEVGGITVPVRSPDGSVSMILRSTGLVDDHLTGEQVRQHAEMLINGSSRIEAALRDSNDPRVAAYLTWRQSVFPGTEAASAGD